jgi:hypothetical protein
MKKKLNVRGVIKGIKDYKAKWGRHVQWIDQRVPTVPFRYTPTDTRDPGRPQKMWKDQF